MKKVNIDPNLFVLVSALLTGEEGVPVGFAFRSDSAEDQDSGWNFWSGEETEAFIKDPENFVRHPLQHFLSLDPSLAQILDAKVGTAWEKDSDTENWIESK